MKILLVVTGGIAAYKACEITSTAIKQGNAVRVVMSSAATNFVGAATFEALTGEPVLLSTFGAEAIDGSAGIDHIEWAKWADVVCVAPATANIIGKLACGIADCAASTVLMAIPIGVPVVIAPAMNTQMWLHPVLQRNLGWLKDLGRYSFVDPVEKRLACGDFGVGGLAEPDDILRAVSVAGGDS
jgi:phosphopantothenoylcysteine decarboxylase/phosphopantothenate--cysteine ligase